MALATYRFYTDTYRGNAITSSDDFDRLILRAERYLDSVKTVEVLPDTDDVKMAQCAVAEEWQTNERGGELQSQSVGSWSQSFAASGKSNERRMMEAAALYIGYMVSPVRWV